jgi:hypothetical protein
MFENYIVIYRITRRNKAILLLKCHLWLDVGLDEGRDFSLGTCDDNVPL